MFLALGATAAFALARVAAAADRPCKLDDRLCKLIATLTATTKATTTAKTTTAASTTPTTTAKTTTTTKTTTTKSGTTTTVSSKTSTTTKTAPAPTGKAGTKSAPTKPSAKTKTAAKASSSAKAKTTAVAAGAKGKTKKKKAAATTATATASISLVDKPFVCAGPVHLSSVTVTIRNVSSDAVLLKNGCTGSIGKINVVQYHGDGIKVGAAHDLVIGGGTIRCYAHDAGKHQDGIQVLGGHNVTFNGMDVGCYSANNSQVWINDGSGNGPGGVPTNIVFSGGRFQGYYNAGQYGPGGAYGVAIVGSVQSGIRNATICPNAHPAHALYVASSAQAPVTAGTVVSRSC
jgi:hypothetical protein